MAHIRQISEDDATGTLRRVYDAAIQRAGGVANILKVMSLDADVLHSSMSLYVSLMKRDNALSARRREMLATVVSNINDCYY